MSVHRNSPYEHDVTASSEPRTVTVGETLVFGVTVIPRDDDNAINDAIDAWHEGDGAKPLHEFLGWTRDEYRAWVEQRPVRVTNTGKTGRWGDDHRHNGFPVHPGCYGCQTCWDCLIDDEMPCYVPVTEADLAATSATYDPDADLIPAFLDPSEEP